eukprot:2711742-Karenia_brevis.AAC.1
MMAKKGHHRSRKPNRIKIRGQVGQESSKRVSREPKQMPFNLHPTSKSGVRGAVGHPYPPSLGLSPLYYPAEASS